MPGNGKFLGFLRQNSRAITHIFLFGQKYSKIIGIYLECYNYKRLEQKFRKYSFLPISRHFKNITIILLKRDVLVVTHQYRGGGTPPPVLGIQVDQISVSSIMDHPRRWVEVLATLDRLGSRPGGKTLPRAPPAIQHPAESVAWEPATGVTTRTSRFKILKLAANPHAQHGHP